MSKGVIHIGIQPSIKSFIKTCKFDSFYDYPYGFDDLPFCGGCYGDDCWDDYSFNKGKFDSDFDDDFDSDSLKSYKSIYFYEDIDTKYRGGMTECDVEFTTVKALQEYCSRQGIKIPKKALKKLETGYVSHCCINLSKKLKGKLVLEVDSSFGSLLWNNTTLDLDR